MTNLSVVRARCKIVRLVGPYIHTFLIVRSAEVPAYYWMPVSTNFKQLLGNLYIRTIRGVHILES